LLTEYQFTLFKLEVTQLPDYKSLADFCSPSEST
jgi:hypothetical protein